MMEQQITHIAQQQEEIKKLIHTSAAGITHQTNNQTNNTTNTNTNSHNKITINVVAFGRENAQHILDDNAFMERCIRRRELGVIDYLQRLHFDPRHPEHHNVRMTNYKVPWLDVHNGEGWMKSSREETLDEMVNDGCNSLDEHYQENKETYAEKLTERMIQMIEDFLENAKNDHPPTLQELRSKLFLMVMNYSKVALGVS